MPYAAAARAPTYRSVTTARPTATPVPATRPWNARSTTSAGPVGAIAQSSDIRVNIEELARIRPRRPRLSLTGPDSSWPIAIPAMKKVSVSCATVDVVPSVARTSGSAEM